MWSKDNENTTKGQEINLNFNVRKHKLGGPNCQHVVNLAAAQTSAFGLIVATLCTACSNHCGHTTFSV